MNNRRGKKVQKNQTFKGHESPVARLQQLLLRVCCSSDAMTTMRTRLREQDKRKQTRRRALLPSCGYTRSKQSHEAEA